MPTHPAIHPDDQHVVAEHDFTITVARHIALQTAQAFARMVGRRGDAHKLLLGAHLYALMEGAGETEALAFVDRLVEFYLDGKATAARRRRG